MSGSKLEMIRILSDGRPGHENQSVGLAEALRRRTGAEVDLVRFKPDEGVMAKIKAACRRDTERRDPQLIIAAGHRTHWPLLAARRSFRARAVVIMKPSLPTWCFDLCLVPRHDLKGAESGARIVATRGALNRLPETASVKNGTGVILIGGPSKHHNWAGAPLIAAIKEIVRREPKLAWTVADSRRTPERFLSEVAALGLPVEIVPHAKTTPGWLPSVLMAAEETWVTEDSTSMIFEAITARSRVGLLPLPAKHAGDRMVRAVDDVVAAGYAVRHAEWLASGKMMAQTAPLHESGRCADEIVRRFFPTI